ncbi:unnamed protein product, partial [Prorocentrum cordatum]
MRGLLSRIHVIPAGPGVTPVELRESASVAERVQEWEAQRSSADDARGDPGTLIELACGEEEGLIELREEDGADEQDRMLLQELEKYILEQVRPMRLDKERVKCPEELLDARELRDYRGLVAKILWAARQSRPDVSGSASMLSAECPQVKIASALMANKVARHLRCTASSCLTIWPLDLSAVTMGQWLWLVFRDALYGDVRGPEWWNSGTSCPFAVALVDECAIAEASEGVAVVDAKSLFDTLSKNCGGAKADRRNAIEMAIVRDSMTAEGTVVRWVPHCKMPADALTKVDPGRGNFALTDLMHKGMLALTDESGSLDERSLNLSLKSPSRPPGLPGPVPSDP